ncbi:potassium:hydrogen antiporter [Moniliophthora roreri MCA 2997]|uniref:Potassium:hydrogen antiporter n=1 Tax=Moniliophthora roreri (strain MCA 2997) TaxID=1381753 RepID=V2X0B0_MONRO|nr:potassium:hydrogen antiporter [Moniliophthora roreri MCA 2997]
MGEFSTTVISFFKRAAPEQGGLLSGKDPTEPNPNDPIRLWIIQIGIIVTTASLLSLALQRIRQPKVIAEVLGGILLGPTAFGRIPGFTEHIFPEDAKAYLSLTANIGLCLFLFLVGLEIDSAVIKRNARLSVMVSLAGMIIPFGLGAALAVPLYHQFIDPNIQFTHFMLFTGVAYSITAFPVLCRILTELKLLDTTVGIVVLSAGVGNDIIGWTLLALSVALVNAGSGVTALYILLVCVGWTLIVLFPIKIALRWLGRKTGSIESGQPTMLFMTVVILCVFGSAFFTDVIGVHAIFGAFLVGLIVPREGRLAIVLTEKLEDMVGIIFLPLYFTLSGLSTDLGLLNNGVTWGYTVAICVLAFVGKFGGCTLAAHFAAGFSWRESSTIGSLMSCKGLVELIVLNVGLSAHILSQRVFSMFVLEALLLTFMTTPLVTTLYPPEKRTRTAATGANFNNVADNAEAAAALEAGKHGPSMHNRIKSLVGKRRSKEIEGSDMVNTTSMRWTNFMVVLDDMEHLPSMMAFTQLVKTSNDDTSLSMLSSKEKKLAGTSSSEASSSKLRSPSLDEVSQNRHKQRISLHPLRLVPISDRLLSTMMKSSSAIDKTVLYTDPVIMVYRMFTTLNRLIVGEPTVEMVNYEDKASSVLDFARQEWEYQDGANKGGMMVMLGWLPPPPPTYHRESTSTAPQTPAAQPVATPRSAHGYNPFEALFGKANQSENDDPVEAVRETTMHAHFVRGVFAQAVKGDTGVDVGLYIEQPVSGSVEAEQHLYLPFFGGPDDRLALEFVAQLCENPSVKATVVRVVKSDSLTAVEKVTDDAYQATIASARSAQQPDETLRPPDTVYGPASIETRMQSDTADAIVWARYATPTEENDARGRTSEGALGRITFRDLSTASPLRSVVQDIREFSASKRIIVLAGRSRRLAVESHTKELKQIIDEQHHHQRHVSSDVRKTVGDVAAAVMAMGVGAGVVVVQAAKVEVF